MKLSALINGAYRKDARDPDITGITADSREVEAGFLFAALSGAQTDGARFVIDAIDKGAVAVIAAHEIDCDVPVVVDPAPRRLLAEAASRFFPARPGFIAGVTGTNGKTSTAVFAEQLWAEMEIRGGSLGTLGAQGSGFRKRLTHTTPEPVTLHRALEEMAEAGLTHTVMEVSSHALAQYRADGVRYKAAGFTNITQDHLDYHDGFDDYLAAKKRLFTDLLIDDGVAVINMDGEGAEDMLVAAAVKGAPTILTGAAGKDLQLERVTPRPSGLSLVLKAFGERHEFDMPVVGAFQAENALVAAGLVIASSMAPNRTIAALSKVTGAPGRMQRAGETSGAAVFVDYAHTPDAVATALKAMRPHAEGRVIVIIGAGGDRDKTKRPMMGRAATDFADIVIVTDDNPRTEKPAAIRADVLRGAPGAKEIGDRRKAIEQGIEQLKSGDILLVAGKGHETGQIIGDERLPFDDCAVVQEVIAGAMNGEEKSL